MRPLPPIYLVIWVAGVASDFYTTYRFYKADPKGFVKNEASGYMRRLYKAFGFKTGLLAFLLFVELPIAAFVSFVLIPVSARVFSLPQPEPLNCLASGLAFHGAMHLAAAGWNVLLEKKKPLS